MAQQKKELQKKELSYKDIKMVLRSNGWVFNREETGNWRETDYHVYEMQFQSADWGVLAQAHISEHSGGYTADHDYGVSFIVVRDAETDMLFFSSDGLNKLLHAIELAEDNLLTVGVPFVADYKFLGKNAANKKRRNAALRRKFNLPEEA